MRYIFALVFFTFLTLKGYAQYPFEKFPVKKYDSVSFKVVDSNASKQIAIAHYKDYTVKLVEEGDPLTGGAIYLYKKSKLLKKTTGYFGRVMATDFPLYIEDIDNNGKLDLIVESYCIAATGLASSHLYTTCFINQGKGNFKIFDFESFYDKPQKEYEIIPGQYVIAGQSLTFLKGHSYWIFDLYQYKNGELINVSKKYNYPIAVPYLNKETFKPTDKISKAELAKLSLKKPDDYSATP